MFIGREFELEYFEKAYKSKQSKILVVYGRRRVGKSYLIRNFVKNKKAILLEGLENEHTPIQIDQFKQDLAKQLKDNMLKEASFSKWEPLFDYLTTYFKNSKSKMILVLDEYQWLAAEQTTLTALIKKYWDNHWINQNVLIILCGSISSYMVKKVIKSKALYGRIDGEISLLPLFPREATQFFKHKRGEYEIIKYLLTLGSVPKYLTQIELNTSFEKNMNSLLFTSGGELVDEYEKIFYSQFKEYRTYEKIVSFLKDGPKTQLQISKALGISSGGGLTFYIENLERTSFISAYCSYERGLKSKDKKYKLSDDFLRFYFKFVFPNLKIIKSNNGRNLFKPLVEEKWNSWLGFAFENFCFKNAEYLSKKMGFHDDLISYGPYFKRGEDNFQIDLLYVRTSKVITVCEIKFQDKEISSEVIKEVERKCSALKVPRGHTVEKALISIYGPDKKLQASEYFHHTLSLKEILR